MKKIYSLLVAASLCVNIAFAGGSCIIDTTNTAFFSPPTDSIPCIERGVAYTQVIQIHVAPTFDVGPLFGFPAGIIILTVDSM